MKTQTTDSHRYCPQTAVRYAYVLHDLNVSKETMQKTREIFTQVPQLQNVFVNPTICEEQKEKVIDEVFPKEIKNFLKVICRHQRMNLIDDVFMAYDRCYDKRNQILNGVLTCIEPPSEAQLKEMQAYLCRKYNVNQAKVEIKTDQALLGGFVLRVGNDEYDWSLRGRLNRLENKLTRR